MVSFALHTEPSQYAVVRQSASLAHVVLQPVVSSQRYVPHDVEPPVPEQAPMPSHVPVPPKVKPVDVEPTHFGVHAVLVGAKEQFALP